MKPQTLRGRHTAIRGSDRIRDWVARTNLASGLDADDMARIDALSSVRYPLKTGNHLYRAGGPLKSLHVIVGGSFKTSAILEDGREQVIGFGLPGETLGFDAIAMGKHLSDTVALEASEVRAIPFAELQQLGRESPRIERNIRRMMSEEIGRHHKIMMLLGGMHGDERLTTFLLNLAERYGAPGVPASTLMLPMTRADIGSFLGLKVETVSRKFTQLHNSGAIRVNGRIITIHGLHNAKWRSGEHALAIDATQAWRPAGALSVVARAAIAQAVKPKRMPRTNYIGSV